MPKAPTHGIGSIAMEAIRAGKTNEQALDSVLAAFPDAQTTLGSISWYRSKLRGDGELVPTNREAQAAQPHAPAGMGGDGPVAGGAADDHGDVDGLDEDSEQRSWGDYPIDDLLIRTEHRTIQDIMRRIHSKFYVLNPDFQRDFLWRDDKQSKLIESVIMRIPLPVFYLAENADGKMVVVDGLQRLATFQRFVNNDLRLSLPERPEFHGRRFRDLRPAIQNRIEDCNLTVYLIDSKVPEQVRLDIFERVNGGVPLTRQQMRNCLYMGHATRFLKNEANTEVFFDATGRSLDRLSMRDREFVNRFCAFRILGYENYRGDMDDFLAKCLTRMNGMNDDERSRLSQRFRQSMASNFLVFGEHAFRKQQPGRARRSVLNASLWDVLSTGLSYYGSDRIEAHSGDVRAAFLDLLTNDDFQSSITYSTNHAVTVRQRFEISRSMLTEVLGACAD